MFLFSILYKLVVLLSKSMCTKQASYQPVQPHVAIHRTYMYKICKNTALSLLAIWVLSLLVDPFNLTKASLGLLIHTMPILSLMALAFSVVAEGDDDRPTSRL